ncbi:MAG: iron-sulfur cluster assembly accessory protein [Deltaproteobacteria bacterium]|nr:MAG: iron-sulfur cluster assembly accessory protein [Deltaproteobacteria bacterium]
MQLREASPGKSARTGETASPVSRSCKSAHFVDFSATCLYRAGVTEHAATSTPAAPLGLTPRAIERVKELRARDGLPPTRALRVAVVGGGCSGFSYQLDFDDTMREDDLVLEYDGVRVLVDTTSAEHLAGTEIDYVSSLHGGGFKFSNPKATHTCGCGSSFAV